MNKVLIIISSVFLLSCATEFRGSAHITPKQCAAKCESWNMTMDAMIAMGEYSDACVCRPKSGSSSLSMILNPVGVVMQSREAAKRNSNTVMH